MWQLDAVQAIRRDWLSAAAADRTTCYPLLAERLEALGVDDVGFVLDDDLQPSVVEQPANSDGRVSAGTATEPQRRFVCTLADILNDPAALEPPVAVVPRLAWAGRVTLLAAREKGGKSTLATAAAAIVSNDKGTWLGEPATHGAVLWVGLEEHTSDLASRMVQYGATPSRVFVVPSLAAEDEPIKQIHDEARSLKPTLIVVDTLAALVDATGARPDSGAASVWTPFMTSLTRIARDTGAAVVLLHHARKSDGKYRDSSAIGANVDVIIEMQEANEPDLRTMRVKARWKVGDYAVKLVGGWYDLVGGEPTLDDRVLRFIASKPGCSMRDVREHVGAKTSDVTTTVHVLIERALVVNKGGPRNMRLSLASSDGDPGDDSGNGATPQSEPPIALVPDDEPLLARSGTTSDLTPDGDSDGHRRHVEISPTEVSP